MKRKRNVRQHGQNMVVYSPPPTLQIAAYAVEMAFAPGGTELDIFLSIAGAHECTGEILLACNCIDGAGMGTNIFPVVPVITHSTEPEVLTNLQIRTPVDWDIAYMTFIHLIFEVPLPGMMETVWWHPTLGRPRSNLEQGGATLAVPRPNPRGILLLPGGWIE